jgi:uncharacterized membrane protein YfcA
VFAGAALLASWLLTRRGGGSGAEASARSPHARRHDLLLAGLPMQLASGTSLMLIAVNALLAFAALGHWPAARLPLMFPLLLGGAVDVVVGQRLAPHLSDRLLRQGFAALLIGTALLSGSEAFPT